MAKNTWNPWKMATIGMALVIATALVTGLVVANWNSGQSKPVRHASATPSAADVDVCNQHAKSQTDATAEVLKDALVGGVIGAGVGAAGGAIAGGGKGAGKGAAIGGLVGVTAGTLYGINESKKNDARYVAAYRTCMRGRGYTV